jgi:NAD(P)H-hydrate repair Nnr-like enzyme with NAD(P)H-hydrate epimerase domain
MIKVPSVTAEEMAKVDKRMVEEFQIDLSIMMENAGRALAVQARTAGEIREESNPRDGWEGKQRRWGVGGGQTSPQLGSKDGGRALLG